MSFDIFAISVTDFSYSNISDIRPEPEILPQENRGDDSDEPQDYDMDEEPCVSGSASEESDQESENSTNEATDKEDDEQPHATADATPANIPSDSIQGGTSSTLS